MKANDVDNIKFSSKDVDLSFLLIRNQLKLASYVLGGYNPSLTRLTNSNLLLMVRAAESLHQTITHNIFSVIRWNLEQDYVIDKIPIDDLDTSDPRESLLNNYSSKTYYRASLSCLFEKDHPYKILSINYHNPISDSNASLSVDKGQNKYVSNVVITTGMEKHGDKFIIVNGNLDLC